jgi:hypothetical protein
MLRERGVEVWLAADQRQSFVCGVYLPRAWGTEALCCWVCVPPWAGPPCVGLSQGVLCTLQRSEGTAGTSYIVGGRRGGCCYAQHRSGVVLDQQRRFSSAYAQLGALARLLWRSANVQRPRHGFVWCPPAASHSTAACVDTDTCVQCVCVLAGS